MQMISMKQLRENFDKIKVPMQLADALQPVAYNQVMQSQPVKLMQKE